jgi:hypothetical protein
MGPRPVERLGWHCGDPPRFLVALGLTTVGAVGETPLPEGYKLPDHREGQIRLAGEVLQSIVDQNEGRLPDGVQETRPDIGELVFVDRDCVHRPPDNENG